MATLTISKGRLQKGSLDGKAAVVTGAGRGIGLEASRSLIWLGATVFIAERNETMGKAAEASLEAEFGPGRARFIAMDVGNEADVKALHDACGDVDIVVNNATVTPIGESSGTAIEQWDLSYKVNLRGPVLMAMAFIPGMVRKRSGAFVCVSSSGAAPFMGPYEVFKTAQVEFANTLAMEMEGKGVSVYTIGPGIARTPGFEEGGSKVAERMGITLDQLYNLNKVAQISPEQAGAGFAASVAMADKYQGTEISSYQALVDAGIELSSEGGGMMAGEMDLDAARPLISRVLATYEEQSGGWKARNVFERQWVSRDFKKHTGKSIDEMSSYLRGLASSIEKGAEKLDLLLLRRLSAYYVHQKELLMGYEKNAQRREEGGRAIDSWVKDIESLIRALGQA